MFYLFRNNLKEIDLRTEFYMFFGAQLVVLISIEYGTKPQEYMKKWFKDKANYISEKDELMYSY